MVTPGQMQMFNKPEPYEAQILGSKYKNQYVWEPSAEIPNAGVYKIRLHDHTLGNALRMELLKDPRVLFAAYRVPHPLEPEIELRIQTNVNCPPQLTIFDANSRLIKTAQHMLGEFDKELDRMGKLNDPIAFPAGLRSIEDSSLNISQNNNIIAGDPRNEQDMIGYSPSLGGEMDSSSNNMQSASHHLGGFTQMPGPHMTTHMPPGASSSGAVLGPGGASLSQSAGPPDIDIDEL